MKALKELKKAKKYLKQVAKDYNPDVFCAFRDTYDVDFDLEKLHFIQDKVSELNETVLLFRKSITTKQK
ncbi:hypothetical protein [Flavobacterium sp.]|uniref:hypothetical protein n=1 Tax=Flavobacterium sp. TaxID=239 RepID=UPI00374CCE55